MEFLGLMGFVAVWIGVGLYLLQLSTAIRQRMPKHLALAVLLPGILLFGAANLVTSPEAGRELFESTEDRCARTTTDFLDYQVCLKQR